MRAKRVWKSISTWQWARSNRRIRRLSTGSASNGHPTIQNHWPVRLLVPLLEFNQHHEYLVLVAKKNRAAAAGRSHGADLHFDDGLTHTAKSRHSPSRQDPNCCQRVIRNQNHPDSCPTPCQKFDPLEFQVTVQRACVFARRTYTLE